MHTLTKQGVWRTSCFCQSLNHKILAFVGTSNFTAEIYAYMLHIWITYDIFHWVSNLIVWVNLIKCDDILCRYHFFCVTDVFGAWILSSEVFSFCFCSWYLWLDRIWLWNIRSIIFFKCYLLITNLTHFCNVFV